MEIRPCEQVQNFNPPPPLNEVVIAVGDWNVVLDYEWDTVGYKNKNNPKANAAVLDLMKILDLGDIYRTLHPDKLRFTWRKGRKESQMSRLDYFLISPEFYGFVTEADIDISYRSDHSLITVDLNFITQERGKGYWKFNNSLLYDPEYVKKVKETINETVSSYRLPENEAFSIDDQMLFEMIKLQVRGITISHSSYKKRLKEREENKIEKQTAKLQKVLDENPTNGLKEEIENKKQQLKNIREIKLKGSMIRSRAKWNLQGEKNSKYFCNLEKRHYTDKLIPKVITEVGRELVDQKAILREQSKFYKNLYRTKNCSITEGQNDVFFPSNQNDQFNVLTEFEKDLCEGLITKSEALARLKQMKRNKSPGTDGYSMEFYLFFWNDISDYLINSINTAYIKKECL